MIIFIDLFKQPSIFDIILFTLAILGFLGGSIAASIKFAHWLTLRNNQWLLNENLRPYFSASDVDRATRYYIPTKFQNVSPAADEEPGKSHMASAKQLLMPMFLDKVFKNKNADTKYYLILADAGMGKTTFLINLFLNYARNPIRNLSGSNDDQPIRLFPLGSPDIWPDIKNIKNKRDTILLLDAFDEDIKAVDDYDARMKEILKETEDFKEIIITCRTQFFPSDEEIPDDTGYTTFGGEQASYRFQRVYLSVFDETDINRYLKKRFSFLQFSKRKKAFEIVKKSPNLVMRPMLLSYIHDFVEADRNFKYSYEIYDVLIEKWIERESKKQGIRKKYGSEEKYRKLLLDFSKSLAINLYQKRDERSGYFITKTDIIAGTGKFQITDIDSDGMGETEVRSKSLLNRDAEGKYKFSHKSILEYFLAKELTQNLDFLSTFDFEGMSAAEGFLNEMMEPFKTIKGGFITTGIYRPLKSLSPKKLNKIDTLVIQEVRNLVYENLSLFVNLEKIVMYDSVRYKLLYDFYIILFTIRERRTLRVFLEEQQWVETRGWSNYDAIGRLLNEFEFIEETKGPVRNFTQVIDLKELREHLERLTLIESAKFYEWWHRLNLWETCESWGQVGIGGGLTLRETVENIEELKRFPKFPKQGELSERRQLLMDCLDQLERWEYFEVQKLRTWIEHAKQRVKKGKSNYLNTLQSIEKYLLKMKLLREKQPRCETFY